MSWFMRLAASWLAGQNQERAERTATHQAPPGQASPADRRPVGIVGFSGAIFARVTDRVPSFHEVSGDGFRLALGRLRGESVVVQLATQSPPPPSVVRALWQGHRPRLLVLLAEGTSTKLEPGHLVLGSEVVDTQGHRYRLGGESPRLPQLQVGAISETAGHESLAICPGLASMIATCRELELPVVAIARIVADAEIQAPTTNLARASGRLIGKWTRRRGGMSRWWNEHTVETTAMERQIDLAAEFVVAQDTRPVVQ